MTTLKTSELKLGKFYQVITNGVNGVSYEIIRFSGGVPYGKSEGWGEHHMGVRLAMNSNWREIEGWGEPTWPVNSFKTSELKLHGWYRNAGLGLQDMVVQVIGVTHDTAVGQQDLNEGMTPPVKLDNAHWWIEEPPTEASVDNTEVFANAPLPGCDLLGREVILNAAKQATHIEREVTHGAIDVNFETVAAIWSAHLGVKVTREKVALMMIDVKTVRAWSNPTQMDHWVDIAGYSAIGGELSDVE